MDIKLGKHQEEGLKFILENKMSGLFMATGCLTGDTIVRVNRGGKTFKTTMERLYKQYYDRDNVGGGVPYDLNIKTYIRSWLGDGFGLNEMIDVVYSGEKMVYELWLDNGCKIQATADHEILTSKGYVELGKLNTGDDVACDECLYRKSGGRKKACDSHYMGIKYHPYMKKVKTKKYRGGFTYRVTRQRVVYEANLNGLSVEEFKRIIRTDAVCASQLRYSDPSIEVIHHKDGNHHNNEVSNLEAISYNQHLTGHGETYAKNFGMQQMLLSKVYKIFEVGIRPTYDIKCQTPYHNFVANGIVVHNCGKTATALMYLKVLDRSAIVVVPAKLKSVWLSENKKFNFGLDMSIDARVPAKILLVSYEWIKLYPEILDDYNTAILDEAMYMVDTDTVRYKELSEKLRRMDRLVLLAGYPVENRLTDIFVVSLITNTLGDNYYHFLYKYFTVIKHRNHIVKCIPKKDSFNKIMNIAKEVVYLCDKKEVMPDNVQKKNLVVRYKLSDYQLGIIDSLRLYGEYRDDRLSITCKNSLSVFSKVMQIISGFVYETEGSGKDIVQRPVFFEENPKLYLIRKILKDKKDFLIWYIFDAEYNFIKEFDGRARLCKIQTDARGLNLQHYKFALYYSVPLSGGQFMQSVDRLYRMGRTTDVVSVIVLPYGEFGDALYNMINNKQELTSKVINALIRRRFHA